MDFLRRQGRLRLRLSTKKGLETRALKGEEHVAKGAKAMEHDEAREPAQGKLPLGATPPRISLDFFDLYFQENLIEFF